MPDKAFAVVPPWNPSYICTLKQQEALAFNNLQNPQNLQTLNLDRVTRRSAVNKPAKKSQAVAPALDTPTDLSNEAVKDISAALNPLVADAFALYLKTKNFHWHVSGRHFRDYHLMLDEHADAIFGSIDEIAERVRKIGGTTLRSIGHVAKLQTIEDNDDAYVPPREMLRELMEDNKKMTANMRDAREVADKHNDSATTSILENFIDATERRTWFLFEASREEGDNAR